MTTWLRRVRGAIGLGLAWGAAWFAAGMVLLVVGLLFGATADVPFPILFGFLGFLAGAAFSGILGLVERSRKFSEMSLSRFAAWGAGGGLLLSGLFVASVTLSGEPGFLGNLVFLAPIFAGAGAACAAGSLALARRAVDRRLPGAGEQPVKRIEDTPAD